MLLRKIPDKEAIRNAPKAGCCRPMRARADNEGEADSVKIEENKLLELRDKALKAQRAVQTFTSYENLLLHRKGKTNKTHRIDLGTGEIVERAA